MHSNSTLIVDMFSMQSIRGKQCRAGHAVSAQLASIHTWNPGTQEAETGGERKRKKKREWEKRGRKRRGRRNVGDRGRTER